MKEAEPVQKNNRQKGMVSIIVVMIVMIVLTLIVVGFAQQARREQRQSLDRQLSTQAYYAAESGINLAQEAIENGWTADNADCAAGGTPLAGRTTFTSSNSDIPCILVDQRLESLEYSSVTEQSTVAPLTSDGGTPFQSITFFWEAKDKDTDFTCGNGSLQFPPINQWNCKTGLLRVDLTNLGTGAFDRNNMINNTFTAFFYPSTSGSDIAFSSAIGSQQGRVHQARCNTGTTPRYCSATITGLTSPRYYTRVRSVYADSAMSIQGLTAGGNRATFVGAQAKIDVTGKAAEVTRRVQVHIPNTKEGREYNYPNFALETADSICKRLSVIPGDPVTTDTTNPACAIN